MKTIKRWLIEAFGFSKTEMNGIWLLLMLIVATAIVPRVYTNYTYKQKVLFETDHEELMAWKQEVQGVIKIREQEKPKWEGQKKEWNKSPKNADNEKYSTKKWVNYEKKEPTPKKEYPAYEKYKPPYTKDKKININAATADEWQKIKGIGPVLSERIIGYKNILGGFSSVDQLKEVYGLKPEILEVLEEITEVDDSIKLLNINTDSLKYLYSHPYIDYKLAKSIINYRKVHGDYDQPDQLLDLKLMSDSLYQKLYPYISVKP